MIIHNIEQRTDEWFEVRAGKVTGSEFSKIITPTGKKSTQYKDLLFKKADEIIYGASLQKGEPTEAMLRGIELEEEAFNSINFETDYNFEEIGFCDSQLGYGCSPDGLSEKNKIGLEIKCPLPHNHSKTRFKGIYDQKYKPQVQGCMMVTGYKEWVYYSYCPDRPSYIEVVKRDDGFINDLKHYLDQFTKELNDIVNKLRSE